MALPRRACALALALTLSGAVAAPAALAQEETTTPATATSSPASEEPTAPATTSPPADTSSPAAPEETAGSDTPVEPTTGKNAPEEGAPGEDRSSDADEPADEPAENTSDDASADESDKTDDADAAQEPSLSDTLSAKIEFDKTTYRPGDTATLTVTLTNGASKAVAGIKATCNRPSLPGDPHVEGWRDPAQWGELAGDGATINAGGTRTISVTGTVPDNADDYGIVWVDCHFNPNGDLSAGGPHAYAAADVETAATGDTWGLLFDDLDGDGWFYSDTNGNGTIDDDEFDDETLRNVKVSLVEPGTGKVVATTRSRESTVVEFNDVPVGPYWLKVYDPWQLVDENAAIIIVSGDSHYDAWAFEVEPVSGSGNPGGGPGPGSGPNNDKPEPRPIEEPPAKPKDDLTKEDIEELADTGVDALTTTLIGVAVVLVGVGAVFLARRRRTTTEPAETPTA